MTVRMRCSQGHETTLETAPSGQPHACPECGRPMEPCDEVGSGIAAENEDRAAEDDAGATFVSDTEFPQSAAELGGDIDRGERAEADEGEPTQMLDADDETNGTVVEQADEEGPTLLESSGDSAPAAPPVEDDTETDATVLASESRNQRNPAAPTGDMTAVEAPSETDPQPTVVADAGTDSATQAPATSAEAQSAGSSADEDGTVLPASEDVQATVIQPDGEPDATVIAPDEKVDATVITEPGDPQATVLGEQADEQAGRHAEQQTIQGEASASLESRPTESGAATASNRYRLVQNFARGGLGNIWVAEDVGIQREVAFKEMLPAALKDRNLVERFVEEAQITGQLEHPGIVPIYDIGWKEDGTPYYSMKLVRGVTLEKAIEDFHALPPESSQRNLVFKKLLRSFVDICNAVAFAHDRGVLHRDLKPVNVMLGAFGETLVLDWGLAKVFHTEADESAVKRAPADAPLDEQPTEVPASSTDGSVATSAGTVPVMVGATGIPTLGRRTVRTSARSASSKTLSGSVMGTPAYMPPEQAMGRLEELDPTSDVYSLGGILYKLLTNHQPVPKGKVQEVLRRVIEGQIEPPRSIDPTIPKALEAICLKAMAREKRDRYPSALALAADVEAFLADEPVSVYRDPWYVRARRWIRRHRTLVTTASAVVAVLLAVLLVWWMVERQRVADLRRMAEGKLQAAQTAVESGDYATASALINEAAGLVGTERSLAALGAELKRQRQSVEREAALREQRRREALAQVMRLRTADADAVPPILESLIPLRDEVWTSLLVMRSRPNLPANERRRIGMAIVALKADSPEAREEVARLREELTLLGADEFLAVRSVLQPFAAGLVEGLWSLATRADADRQRRFRAACALALFDTQSPQWDTVAADVVSGLLMRDPLELPGWIEAVRPVRDRLRQQLEVAFRSGETPQGRRNAALVLAELFADRPAEMARLALDAEPAQLRLLLRALKQDPPAVVEALLPVIAQWQAAVGNRTEAEQRDRPTTNAAVVLAALGQWNRAEPLFLQSPDKRVRTRFIHEAATAGVDPSQLLAVLQPQADPFVLSAVLLTLGEYTTDLLPPGQREALVPRVLELFRSHPHPGVHSAAEWLLGRWGYADAVAQATAELTSDRPRQGFGWHVNRHGQTLAVVPSPVEFMMGSPADEPGRVEQVGVRKVDVERRLRCRIPRRFGIATREVTVAQFRRFLEDHQLQTEYAPDADCPVLEVTWYEAARYCRWLSEQEGIPEDEMCYPPIDQIRDGMRLPDDYLDRTGYRLPTSAEWEYACRAGALTARPFGETAEFLPRYAWYFDNAENRSWPVGRLKPNAFGLYDVLGNALEWCDSWYFDDPTDGGRLLEDGVLVDGSDRRPGFMKALRGGAFQTRLEQVRCADRDHEVPVSRSFVVGFRIARTYPPADAK